MRRFLWALLLLGIPACGWDAYLKEHTVYDALYPPYRVSFATEIDAQQGNFNALALAVEMWNDAHDGLLVIDQDPTSDFLIYVGPYESLLEDARGGSLRVPEGQLCAIYIPPENVGDTPLLAHEIGHCLGFGHTRNSVSIMYHDPEPYSGITFDIGMVLEDLIAAGQPRDGG
ncbi:MAG: hypothetical protein U1F66_11070 [bacterium]